MSLTAVQRAFLWCIGPNCVIPALARSSAGIDELIPTGTSSHGGPIHESAIAAANGWMPNGEGGQRRFHSWGTYGPRLELHARAFTDPLVTVTRQQLRTYARTLPYEIVAQLRAVDTQPLRRFEPHPDEADSRRHADQLLAQALDLELPGQPRDYAPWTQMELW